MCGCERTREGAFTCGVARGGGVEGKAGEGGRAGERGGRHDGCGSVKGGAFKKG